MKPQTIIVCNQKYKHKKTYKTYEEAKHNANQLKQKTKRKYFILPLQEGTIFPKNKYAIYIK